MKLRYSIIGCIVMLVSACSSDKEPAEAAVKAGQAAIEAAREEATRYAPEQLAKLETVLRTSQEMLAKKDYTGALVAAKDLVNGAQAAAKAAAGRKDELTRDWEDINTGLPGELQRIAARFESLGNGAPPGLTPEQFTASKATFETLGKQLQDARQAALSGEIPKAVDLGSAAKAKAAEIAQAIGVTAAQ